MQNLRDFIDNCHRNAVVKGHYTEVEKAELPPDTGQMIATNWMIQETGVIVQVQRKEKILVDDRFAYEIDDKDFQGIIPAAMDSRKAHALRQVMHLVAEIGEFLNSWEDSGFQEWDYEEFADIFIVWADIAGFVDSDKVIKAVEKKMTKNSMREFGYGRPDIPIDLSHTPGAIEGMIEAAPTFDVLAKALDSLTEEKVTAEGCTCGADCNCAPCEEDKSYKKAQEPQEETLQKIYANDGFAQGHDSYPIEREQTNVGKLSK